MNIVFKAGRNLHITGGTIDVIQLHQGWLLREYRGYPTRRSLCITRFCSFPFSSHYFNVTGLSISILTNILMIYYTFVWSISHMTESKPYVYYALLNSLKVLSSFEKLFTCSTVIWVEQPHMLVSRTGFKNSLEILNPEASTGVRLLASIICIIVVA